MEDKASALVMMMSTLGLTLGSIVGGWIYDAFDRVFVPTDMVFLITTCVSMGIYVFVNYVWYGSEMIRDYDTLDGLSTTTK